MISKQFIQILSFTSLLSTIPFTTYPMNNLSNETIVLHIAPHLNRVERDTFKTVSKKYNNLIPSQDKLNTLLATLDRKYDSLKFNATRQQGAFVSTNEEIYELFIKNQQKISKRLLHKYKRETYDTIFNYGILADNLLFIKWLLNEMKPHYNGSYLASSINFSKQNNCHQITQVLEQYKKDHTPETYKSYLMGKYGNDWCP